MHPFCCFSSVTDHTASQAKPLPDLSVMTSPPARSQNHHTRSNSQVHNHQNHNQLNGVDGNRPSREAPPVDAMIKGIIGNGVSGILCKWVNYRKGWRPRWFVLQDGVLSYYKIHGPDKIIVNQESEKGCKVIGDESLCRISRSAIHGKPSHCRRKPFGEVHLKISSIHESRSDDKKFSIFTGTRRLHLRAETRDDRAAWMEALQALKDIFPRMSNRELMAPSANLMVSTEKLRQRLQEEGLSEAAIDDSEKIMRNEFSALKNQILLLKQKQWLLRETLRQLEVYVMNIRKRRIENSSSSSSTVSPAFHGTQQFFKAS